MIKYLSFFLLFVLLHSNPVFAFQCVKDKQETIDRLKNAYFIGVMKVLDRFDSSEIEGIPEIKSNAMIPLPSYFYTVQPIQSFTDKELKEPFMVWGDAHVSAWTARKGSVFINAVIPVPEENQKRYPHRKYFISHHCFTIDEALEEAGYKMPEEKSEAFLSLEKECLETGGNFVLENNRFVCVSE